MKDQNDTENSVDPNQMLQGAVLDQGPCCLHEI